MDVDWPRPRIKRYRLGFGCWFAMLWVCFDDEARGFGVTPGEAYEKWVADRIRVDLEAYSS